MKKVSILFLLACTTTKAQDLKTSGMEHFNNERWAEASKDFKKHLKKNKTDSSVWFNLAMANLNLGGLDEALEYFKEAEERKFPPIQVFYNRARLFAKKGDETGMAAQLQKAADAGMAGFNRPEGDEAFEKYRQGDGYQKALNTMKNNAYPCRENADSRHFDFWLGEWDVFVNGTKVGENSITRAKGGCAIHENYVTPGLYAGQSINYFDPIDQKWHQHWVGSSGDVYNYLETDRGPGMLQFQSDFLFGGQRSISRLTFTLLESGDVRQLFESSTDGGKTWTSAFDGIYKKKN